MTADKSQIPIKTQLAIVKLMEGVQIGDRYVELKKDVIIERVDNVVTIKKWRWIRITIQEDKIVMVEYD